jgi:hypothetical protein
MMMEKIRLETCPKCGERITYIERRKIGRHIYLYAAHRKRKGTKSMVKKCYLGKETSILLKHSIGQEKAQIPEREVSTAERIKIPKDTLNDIIMYYDKRRTKGLTKERRAKAIEIFRKVFSTGTRIVEVEG